VVLRGRRLGSRDRRLFEHEPIRRELYVSPFDLDSNNLPAIRQSIGDFAPQFIHGYPSAMEVLGKSYRQAKVAPPKLRALLAVSENIYPGQRELLEQLFDCRLFSFYGMTEKGALAAECEVSQELHVNPFYGVLELIDEEGRPIEKPDTRGEIVVTGLISRAMPLFRFRTGDYASWSGGPCACGRALRRLRAVEGRWRQEHLVGGAGALISMTALNVHSAVFDNTTRFQFYQEIPGQATILIEPSERFSEDDAQAILAELGAKLSGQVVLTLRLVDKIPQSPIGKQRFIDQRIQSEGST
jgi:phenylacetate-CoA ligase